jgi:hypothetical protein
MGAAQLCEVSKCLEAGQKEVGPASHRRESRQIGDFFPDRALRDLVFQRAILGADDRVAFVAELVKAPVICPNVLRELELPDEASANDERRDAALRAVLRRIVLVNGGRRLRRDGSCGVGSCCVPCRADSCGACASRAALHSHAGPSACS